MVERKKEVKTLVKWIFHHMGPLKKKKYSQSELHTFLASWTILRFPGPRQSSVYTVLWDNSLFRMWLWRKWRLSGPKQKIYLRSSKFWSISRARAFQSLFCRAILRKEHLHPHLQAYQLFVLVTLSGSHKYFIPFVREATQRMWTDALTNLAWSVSSAKVFMASTTRGSAVKGQKLVHQMSDSVSCWRYLQWPKYTRNEQITSQL